MGQFVVPGMRMAVPQDVTLKYLLIKDCAMAAKLIDLTEYRKRKQEEQKSKSVKEQGTPKVGPEWDPFGFLNPFSLYPFEHSMIVDVTEPTDSDGE
jgi:hypothetical protein